VIGDNDAGIQAFKYSVTGSRRLAVTIVVVVVTGWFFFRGAGFF